jgi:hypothetical protein
MMSYIRNPLPEESRFILKVLLTTQPGCLFHVQHMTDSSHNPAALSAPASDSTATELRQFLVQSMELKVSPVRTEQVLLWIW